MRGFFYSRKTNNNSGTDRLRVERFSYVREAAVGELSYAPVDQRKNGEVDTREKLILECGFVSAGDTLTELNLSSAYECFRVRLERQDVRVKIDAGADKSAVNFCGAGADEGGSGIDADSNKGKVPGIVINAECGTILPINIGQIKIGGVEGGVDTGLG